MEFPLFFAKQREMLQIVMPDRFLLRNHIELFETAYDQLKRIEPILDRTPETQV